MSLSLANRLQARQGGLGSILYKVTWKHWITPAGRLIPAQRAVGHRSSDKDCTGWVRPTVRDWKDTPGMALVSEDGRSRIDQLPRQAVLTGWPRPTVGNATGGQRPPEGTTAEGRTPDGRKVTVALPHVTTLAGWPRPQAGNPGKPGQYNPAGNTDASRKTCAIAATVEYRFIPPTFGAIPTGSCAVIQTERVSGPLNPRMTLWLMLGPFASMWLQAAERVEKPRKRKR